MNVNVELRSDTQGGAPAPVQCCLCLQSGESVRLTRRNLFRFYSVCSGTWRDFTTSLVCQFCWTRATNFIKFIEHAREAQHVILSRTVLTDVEIKELQPFSLCKSIPEDAIIYESPEYVEVKPIVVEKRELEITFEEPHDNSTDLCDGLNDEVKVEPNDNDSDSDSEQNVTEQNEETTDADAIPTEKEKTKESNAEKNEDSAEVNNKKIIKKYNAEIIAYTLEDQLLELQIKKNSERYKKSKYKCEKCGAAYNEKGSYEAHVNKNHDESAGFFECEVCFYRYPSLDGVARHRGSHYRRYRCLTCLSVHSSLSMLASHHSRCTAEPETYYCRQCCKFYKTKHYLMRHMNRAHKKKDKKYMCDSCGKAYQYKSQIRDHVRSHSGVKPFECETCGKKSVTMALHTIHIKTHAPPKPREEREDCYCVECDVYLRSPIMLRYHLTKSKLHAKDALEHACSECPERFPMMSHLRLHIQTVHLKNRTHPCSLCDKAYFTKGALKMHTKNKHEDRERTRDHVCNVCGRAFLTRQSLRHHVVAIHHKERPHACTECNATFGYKAALFTHTKLKHKRKEKSDV